MTGSTRQSSFLACARWIASSASLVAMTAEYTFAIPRRIAPESCKNLSPKEGVGNAGCQRTRSRACSVESTRVSHHGYAETPGIPARNGFNGFLRTLPGDRAFLSPSPLRSLLLTSLTPASRRQDHTTSPSALALFVKSAAASIASRPNVRDDGQRPSLRGQDSGRYKVICVFGKPEYFCKRGWTGYRQTAPLICPSGRVPRCRVRQRRYRAMGVKRTLGGGTRESTYRNQPGRSDDVGCWE